MKSKALKKTLETSTSSASFFFGIVILLLLVGLIFALGQPKGKTKLTFGTCLLTAEVARTDLEKAQGLSGRANIPKDYAMIFPFQQEKPFFWMKDMLTPIDIVWVSGKKVIKVDAKVPADDGAIHYQAPVSIDWVVEVAPGLAHECEVKEGTTLKGLRS